MNDSLIPTGTKHIWCNRYGL